MRRLAVAACILRTRSIKKKCTSFSKLSRVPFVYRMANISDIVDIFDIMKSASY